MAMPRSLAFIWLSAYHCCFFPTPPSALINVARNLGGSMGVALVQTILAQRQQFHQSRLIEHIAPSDIGYQQTIEAMTRYFQAQGPMHPTRIAGGRLGRPDAAASGSRPSRLYRRTPV